MLSGYRAKLKKKIFNFDVGKKWHAFPVKIHLGKLWNMLRNGMPLLTLVRLLNPV